MVGTKPRARGSPRRSRSIISSPVRYHSGMAGDQSTDPANPLALADAKSIEMDDLIVAERRYPHRVGQTYRLKYNPKHRWFYFPEMRRDEALVFKVFDSEKDGRARFTPHTS